MNSIVNRFGHLMKCAVMGGVRKDHDVDIVRKITMINVVSMVAMMNLIPLGYSAFTKGDFGVGLFDFVAALVLAANQVHLRTTGKHNWSVYSGVGVMGGLFFFLFYTGGVDHSGHLWFYPFPLCCFFLLGSKKGAIATFLLLGSSLLALSLTADPESMAMYTDRFQIRLVASVVVVMVYAHFFESTRKEAQEALTIKNIELEQKIVAEEMGAKILKQAKETAEAANRAKSEFLANMSHELRTPLNHIIGFTELVVDKNFGDLNETQGEYLGDVLTSSRHLLSLINDILDLSKVESGKMELELSDVNLKALLENSLVMIREKAMKNGIQLSTDIKGIPEIIRADARKLKQILYNLLSNAVKFTPKGGEIRLTTKFIEGFSDWGIGSSFKFQSPNPLIQISVADSGIGVKPQDLERIFSPFEQVEASANRRFPGTGLGLSLTRNLVELHGGRILAESEGEGKGSTFRLVIPV